MGRLLVPAEIDEAVAVAHNGLPLLLKQSLQLREVLQDDGHAYASGSHDGQDLIEVIGEAHVSNLRTRMI